MDNLATTPDLRVAVSYRQILKIALPISFAIFVPQINFITNNIFLGRLGEEELATAGITGVAYLIFAVIGLGLNNGLQVLISRRAGEGRTDEIGKLFAQGVRISIVIAAAGILVIYFAAPYLFQLALRSESIREKSISFLQIRIWGLPFLYIYQMRNALLVGTNQSRYLIAGAVAETLANIFFDYGLIYGHFGLPALGFNGAAYASIIAEFTGMIIVFFVIHIKGISKRFNLFRHFKTDVPAIRLILVQSSPLILQFAVSIISWHIFYILIEHHGSRALAISNTMRNIFGLFGISTWAFSSTANTMVSNVIGQGLHEKVPLLIRKIISISLLTSIFFCVVLNIFPGVFLSIFGQGREFLAEAIPVVRVISTALVLMSVSNILLSAVTGSGNSRISLVIELVTLVLYLLYVYVVLEELHLSIVYGWISEWVYWISIMLLSLYYMRGGRWKEKKI